MRTDKKINRLTTGKRKYRCRGDCGDRISDKLMPTSTKGECL